MTRGDTERWFIRRGVPHFIASYNAREDVLTRAAPFLTLVFLFSSVSAIDLDWPPWGIALASIAGLVLLLSVWMVINRLRDRPRLAPPDRVGGVEIAVFLLVPTGLPLLFGGDLTGAVLTFLTLLAILGLVYLATSYGLVSMATWGLGQMVRTLGQTFRLFTRSLPLLLLGFMFLFVNAEAWQAAGRLERPLLFAVVILFAALAGVFLLTQIPRELVGLNEYESWSEVYDLAAEAADPGESTRAAAAPSPPPLTRRETGNLWLVVFVSQVLRLVLVSALVGAFFVALGLLVVRPDTIALWTGAPPKVLLDFTIAGTAMTLTEELLQVSGFLAAFAVVYFSVYTTTDATLRADFFEDTVAEVRQNLAVRAIYRAG